MTNFFKNNWKIILIVLFFILMVGNCVKKGNYKRALNSEIIKIGQYTDSVDNANKVIFKKIDSLSNCIILLEEKNTSLEDRNNLLKDFNGKTDENTKSREIWLQNEYNELKKENRELKEEIKSLKELLK